MYFEYSPGYRPQTVSNENRCVNSLNNNIDTEQVLFTNICEDLMHKLTMVFRYTCCLPFPVSDKFCYTMKTETPVKKKKITFNLTPLPTISSVEEEIPSPIVFDSLEVEENPALDSSRKRKKLTKFKNFFKPKKRQLDNEKAKQNKCCGECTQIHGKASLASYPESEDSVLTVPDNYGDGPQKRQRLVSGFFNEIYSCRNCLDT